MPPGGQRTIGRHVVISLCAACTGCIAKEFDQALQYTLCLGAACTGCIHRPVRTRLKVSRLCLGAACTGCIRLHALAGSRHKALPRRCLHGVHPQVAHEVAAHHPLPRRCLHGVHPHDTGHYCASRWLCLGAACTGCIFPRLAPQAHAGALPRRCLHGVHPECALIENLYLGLCLGAACTGCIGKSRQIAAHHFVAYAVSR